MRRQMNKMEHLPTFTMQKVLCNYFACMMLSIPYNYSVLKLLMSQKESETLGGE